MDMNDFFRGFFGFPRMRPGFNDPPFNSRIDFTDPDEDNSSSPHRRTEADDDDMFPNLFHHMEDMFNCAFTFQPIFVEFSDPMSEMKQPNPRDLMLKPDCESCDRNQVLGPTSIFKQDHVDSDSHGILPKGQFDSTETLQPSHWSYQKSFVTKVVRLGNGVVEEHHTVKDGSGKTVTTVRKSLGDKTYELTTQVDENGVVEKKENFINIDQDEIPQFEDALKGSLTKPTIEPTLSVAPSAPPGDPKYLSIFRKLFGS